jgi:hypothetical protein
MPTNLAQLQETSARACAAQSAAPRVRLPPSASSSKLTLGVAPEQHANLSGKILLSRFSCAHRIRDDIPSLCVLDRVKPTSCFEASIDASAIKAVSTDDFTSDLNLLPVAQAWAPELWEPSEATQ